jgi:hypothetical protein
MVEPCEKPRRWLILSHAYNVDGRAESLTITDKISYLLDAGIEPVVLSSTMGHRDSRCAHHQFLPWGPAGLRFDLRHVLLRRWGRSLAYRLCMGTLSVFLAPFILIEQLMCGLRSQWSWAMPATVRAWWLLHQGEFELVYSSGGVSSAHLAGYWLQSLTGCRWIAEVHDPLLVPGEVPRTRQAKFLARLEGRICRHAHLAWWFTEGALASARRRHPELGERGLMVLPGALPPKVGATYQSGPQCVLGHFGSLSNTRSLSPVLLALSNLLVRRADLRSLVRIEVFGAGLDAQALHALSALHLRGVVHAMGRLEFDPATGLTGRARVMQRMQQMDALLLLHGQIADCQEYIPSKLYDYFWAQRPVLALTHTNSQLDALVQTHKGWVASYADKLAIELAIEKVVDCWKQNGGLPAANVPAISPHNAVHTILQALEKMP